MIFASLHEQCSIYASGKCCFIAFLMIAFRYHELDCAIEGIDPSVVFKEIQCYHAVEALFEAVPQLLL